MNQLFDAAPDNSLRLLPSEQLAQVHSDWLPVFEQPAVAQALSRLDAFLRERLDAGAIIFPHRVFRALEKLAPTDVRVIILGQDPYHGANQAQGLAFSVPNACKLPPSLRNIFNELARTWPDQPRRRRHDLTDWMEQGVLLLNASLTVEQGLPGSHAKKGWEIITDAVLECVASSPQPKVFMLWGNHAQAKQRLLEPYGRTQRILLANHPSPLSALRPPRPFIGCGHFDDANAWLKAHNNTAIDWIGKTVL